MHIIHSQIWYVVLPVHNFKNLNSEIHSHPRLQIRDYITLLLTVILPLKPLGKGTHTSIDQGRQTHTHIQRQFSTGVLQEFLKHAIPDYLVRH